MDSSPKSVSDVVTAYFNAQNQHLPAALVALFADDGTYFDTTMGIPLQHQMLYAFFDQAFVAFPNLSYEVTNINTTRADHIVVKWRMRGKNSGPLGKSQTTGRTINVEGSSDFVIQEDRIRTARTYLNYGTMLKQLGQK